MLTIEALSLSAVIESLTTGTVRKGTHSDPGLLFDFVILSAVNGVTAALGLSPLALSLQLGLLRTGML